MASKSRSRSRSPSGSKSRSRSLSSSLSRSKSRSRSVSDERDGYRLHIADIGDDVRKSDLDKIFAPYGELKEVWLTNSTPCFGFVVFKDKKDAAVAVKACDGAEVCGNRIRVSYARPRTRGQGRRYFTNNMRCYQCGYNGHFYRDCPEITGGSDNRKDRFGRERRGGDSRRGGDRDFGGRSGGGGGGGFKGERPGGHRRSRRGSTDEFGRIKRRREGREGREGRDGREGREGRDEGGSSRRHRY